MKLPIFPPQAFDKEMRNRKSETGNGKPVNRGQRSL